MIRTARPPGRWARTLVLGLAIAVPAGTPQAQSGAPTAAARSNSIRIPFEKYTLPNGLTVILSQDRTTPTVAVEMLYHVGSKNEKVGQTGFAHLFEHVMFTGSGHVPYGVHDRLTEGVGGGNNGSTSNDVTNYYETIPANYLETAIWLESDRMGWLLESLDTEKYNAQRSIVQNERRQGVDNVPYGRASEIIDAAMFPKDHPYSWPIVGHMADLQAAPVDAVKDFFRLYYAPNNATLTVVGDFDTAKAKQWIAKYFGEIPKGKPIVRPNVPTVTMNAERRLVYEDRVQIPRLYVTWPTVGMKHDDRYALRLLGSILTGSRTARLTNELVYQRQWAASIGAGQGTNESMGQFSMSVTPRPTHDLTKIELAIDSVIDRIKKDGPTDEEIKRAKAGDELQFVAGLQSNLGKATSLSRGQTFYGNPEQLFTVDYQKSSAVTAADVRRVANQYLGKGRVVLSVVPMGQKAQASKPDQSELVTGDNK